VSGWRPEVHSSEYRGRIVGTDGSVRGDKHAVGSAFLDEAGDWWLTWVRHDPGSLSPHASLHAELRAICRAVTKHPHRVTVLSDCLDATNLIHAWQMKLDKPIPGYRDGKTLNSFARSVRTEPDLVDVRWIAGHQGHPLNEGADALARLASRVNRDGLSKDYVRQQASEIAAAFTAAFHAKFQAWEKTVRRAA
jgi:ribonuclease HI